MDRKYRKADRVNVYGHMADHDNGGAPITTLSIVPYSYGGMDYYEVEGVVRPGWIDRNDTTADAFVVVTGPGSTMRTEAA